MKAFLFMLFALFAIAYVNNAPAPCNNRPDPVNVVDNNRPDAVLVADNNRPDGVLVVDNNRPDGVLVVDNNQAGGQNPIPQEWLRGGK
ncbi:unnamed protein product [Arctia plantaginis]|uniref:Uncharacterized protein n=1 Tax=Arctia plantaginis TaxID=874455 RepID=A0A8S0Z973_ARCPL|nr:unnamed protein product [Arctia plantaginis]